MWHFHVSKRVAAFTCYLQDLKTVSRTISYLTTIENMMKLKIEENKWMKPLGYPLQVGRPFPNSKTSFHQTLLLVPESHSRDRIGRQTPCNTGLRLRFPWLIDLLPRDFLNKATSSSEAFISATQEGATSFTHHILRWRQHTTVYRRQNSKAEFGRPGWNRYRQMLEGRTASSNSLEHI